MAPMSRSRIAMRKIREVLRLTFGEGLSRRQVSAASGVPFTTVSDYVGRAVAAGVGWPLPGGLDDAGGEVALRAELFVAVAGASNYLYAEAFPSQELLYWVTGHVHCFEHMAGCPQIVVCDNLRSAVTRPHRYEPDVNATYAEMAGHYGVAVIPARAYKPRDKPRAAYCTSSGRFAWS
jgi:hypothetical protein